MTFDEWLNEYFIHKDIKEELNYVELLNKYYGKEVIYEIAYGLPRLERETIEIKELP